MNNTRSRSSRAAPAPSVREEHIPGDRSGPEDVMRQQQAQRLKIAIPLIFLIVGVAIYFLFFYHVGIKDDVVSETRARLDQSVPADITVPAIPITKTSPSQLIIDPAVAPIPVVPAVTTAPPPPPRNPNADRMGAAQSSLSMRQEGGIGGGATEGERMKVTQLAGAKASVIPNPTMTITRGTPFGDCLSTVKINTEIPGQITCVLVSDVYGVNKKVVLLAKGTRIVGEQVGQLAIGQERMLGMVARAETPDHVIINLGSSFTDQLGQSGISGDVDSRFLKRLGPALAFSVLDALTLSLSNKSGGGGGNSVIVGAGGATRNTAQSVADIYKNIPPVIKTNHGSRLSIIANQDLDFSGAVKLKRIGE